MAAFKSPLQLYRYLIRCVKKLPFEAQPYYRHHIKMGFKSHADESDKERINQIMERAIEDADWVLLKKQTAKWAEEDIKKHSKLTKPGGKKSNK